MHISMGRGGGATTRGFRLAKTNPFLWSAVAELTVRSNCPLLLYYLGCPTLTLLNREDNCLIRAIIHTAEDTTDERRADQEKGQILSGNGAGWPELKCHKNKFVS